MVNKVELDRLLKFDEHVQRIMISWASEAIYQMIANLFFGYGKLRGDDLYHTNTR